MANRLATPEEVCSLTSAFANLPPETLEWFLESAGQDINLECWGEKASQGHALLTAHYMTVAGLGSSGGERGPVTSKKIDKLAITYGSSVASASDELASTKWGRLYLSKRKTIIIAPMVARRNLPLVVV